MKIFLLLSGFLLLFLNAEKSLQTPYGKGNGNQTPTYSEVIEFYRQLQHDFAEVKLLEYGITDAGEPLHLVLLDNDMMFNMPYARMQNKGVMLINNGIHPGEPCGIDASMMLARDILTDPAKRKLLDKVVLCIIPVYNVGGMLNRNGHSRANQLGPEEYGFRGNAKNLDLNRDFIKMDSKNAQAFAQVMLEWQPDFFVDTHTSNGADYQNVMTLISTQKDKLGGVLGNYLHQQLEPRLYSRMADSSLPMVPYVMQTAAVPDSGIIGFLETPRYATGYAALFGTIGFTTEAHMLKPYNQRVQATYEFLEILLDELANDRIRVAKLRREWKKRFQISDSLTLNWVLDESRVDSLLFAGYTSEYKLSKVTGLQRLYYNREKPYKKNIPYRPHYLPVDKVQVPEYYIIPRAWQEVVQRLKLGGVHLSPLGADTAMEAEVYYIGNFETVQTPYEGHYLHYNTKVRKENRVVQFRANDYKVEARQENIRFIMETLEPVAVDSWFNWNFFDAILQQKEYFSSYIFEETADSLLKADTLLAQQFNEIRQSDTAFAANARVQLDFIYKRSPYYEKSHRRYPVARVFKN